MLIPLLMICLKLIPLAMTATIFLMMICLAILLSGPHRAAMILLSVWLGWKLRLNAVGGSRQKLLRVNRPR